MGIVLRGSCKSTVSMAVLTSESDVEAFLNRETVEEDLLKLSKSELLLISDYHKLEFTRADRKAHILSGIQSLLGFSVKGENVEQDIENGSLSETAASGKGSLKGDELSEEPLRDVVSEVEKLRYEYELRKLEVVAREKELEFTLARDRIKAEREEKEREKEARERERERERENEREREREKEEREREREEKEREREERERGLGSMSWNLLV